jgi:hypothetical protein
MRTGRAQFGHSTYLPYEALARLSLHSRGVLQRAACSWLVCFEIYAQTHALCTVHCELLLTMYG